MYFLSYVLNLYLSFLCFLVGVGFILCFVIFCRKIDILSISLHRYYGQKNNNWRTYMMYSSCKYDAVQYTHWNIAKLRKLDKAKRQNTFRIKNARLLCFIPIIRLASRPAPHSQLIITIRKENKKKPVRYRYNYLITR